MTHLEKMLPSDNDRAMMRDAARGIIEQIWPTASYEQMMRDPAQWKAAWVELCRMGFSALGSDPADGGLREIAAVLGELGRAACILPMLPAAIANLALAPLRDREPAAATFLDAMHAGEAIPAFTFGDCDPDRTTGAISIASGAASGTLRYVEGGEIATHLLVFMRETASLAIIACTRGKASIEPTRAMGAPGIAQVRLDAALATLIQLDDETIAAMLAVSRVGLAARSHGAMRRVFDIAVDYAKERKQFGRTIGSFQALQHKLVDNLMALDGVRLSVEFAAECHDLGNPHWRLYSAATFAAAGGALRQVALENHHAFGAIGYAEEHEAPRHFKRIHVDMIRHGGVRQARAELADFYLGATARKVPELDLGEAGNAFREEVRTWLAEAWPPERADAFHNRPYKQREFDPGFPRQLGKKGWIGLNWPKQAGGQERTPLELIGFMEVIEQAEAPRAGAPVHGNMLIMKGTPEQQAERLPEILAGRAVYGMGLSEPNSGSDLASLKTRAVRDGDDWVIDGQKIWCTTFFGEYLLVAARTDPDAQPQHAGISAFIVRTDAPGLTIQPTATMYDGAFANLFFDDVRVPDKDMIGAQGTGWEVIISALGTERGYYGGQMIMQLVKQFETLCFYLRDAAGRDGMPLASDPVIRDRIGDLICRIEIGRRMMLDCARSAEGGVTPLEKAAISKVYSGELMEHYGEAALDILGMEAALSFDAAGAIQRGQIEQRLRNSLMWVISLGTSEIQRNLIAKVALGMPSK
jgi:alkylation response protein AidB-like acyl-CoA dehydrogenase